MHYPKWIFHKTEAAKIVNNEVEHAEAGEGWEETPAAFDQESDETKGKSPSDKAGKKQGSVLAEKDFVKMKVAELKKYLVDMGVSEDSLDGKTKDELIALIGAQ